MATSQSASSARYHLQSILGITFGMAVGIGAMVGSGIMRTPSLIAAAVPSAGLIIALWVVGGLHAALGVNNLAELATAVPKAGGVYVYARRAFGDAVGLLVGWSDWVAYTATIAAASVSFAEFLSLLWPAAGMHKVAIAVTLQAVLYCANAAGLREGRVLQETTSLLKTLMLFAFVAAAVAVAWFVPAAAPPHPTTGSTPVLGLASVVIAYQMVVAAYSGWAGPTIFSEENTNPGRNLPIALALGLLTTAVLYISVNLGLLAVLGAHGLAQSTLPFTRVLAAIGGALPGMLFAVGAMIVVASCANAAIMSGGRVLFALSRDGLLPSALQSVNKGGSPAVAFALAATISVALATTGSFAFVFGLIGTLQVLVGFIVDGAFFSLRMREPALERPFRARFYPYLPALVMAIDGTLLVLFARADRTGVLFALGLAAACVPFAWIARRARLRLSPVST
ncbi:MAG TPA: APC family permease [Alphaproteobacteria bacterium]|jgi:APA family basic amino acid/polyamine antiporter|nr:APC family permease [Alphaproteobacteria bacterium]